MIYKIVEKYVTQIVLLFFGVTMVMCYSIEENGLYLLFTDAHIQYLGANCHICNKHMFSRVRQIKCRKTFTKSQTRQTSECATLKFPI